MNKQTKKSLLILLIVLLVVINISALLTIIYSQKVQEPPLPPLENYNLKDEIASRGMYHFIKDELQLSDKQFEQFRDINRTNMIKSREIASELNRTRREMMNEIAKENPNTEKLDSFAQDIGALHYNLKKLTINHFLELKEICTADQQESLQKLFMKLLSDQDKDNFRHNAHERGRNRRERPHRRN